MKRWLTEIIETDPHILLTDWAVMRVALPNDERGPLTAHFIGVRSGKPPQIQVSSPVLAFDPQTSRGRTQSGRIYQLNGFSPVTPPVLATWTRWKQMNRIRREDNVTAAVVREIFAAARTGRRDG